MSASAHIVLVHPVIPQNTGSIARLCACTGATLHLVHPLGFQTDEKSVRRAGLDYWEHVDIREHESWESFVESESPAQLYFLTKFGKKSFYDQKLSLPAYLVLGSETKGLPNTIHETYADNLFQIPMRTHLVRSHNLAQCAALVLYETLRQNNSLPKGS